jgi:hypothetical protein
MKVRQFADFFWSEISRVTQKSCPQSKHQVWGKRQTGPPIAKCSKNAAIIFIAVIFIYNLIYAFLFFLFFLVQYKLTLLTLQLNSMQLAKPPQQPLSLHRDIDTPFHILP